MYANQLVDIHLERGTQSADGSNKWVKRSTETVSTLVGLCAFAVFDQYYGMVFCVCCIVALSEVTAAMPNSVDQHIRVFQWNHWTQDKCRTAWHV